MLQHHRKIPVITAFLFMTTVSTAALAGITQSIEDALNFYHYGHNGAIKVDLNYRYENVDQDKGGTPNPHTANANTARLRIGLLSPVFHGLQGYAEYEGNLAMQEDFNSTRNGNTGFSTVADPEKSELNQLWISYAGIPDTVIKGGRQRIKLDDDRFIGNVGWRQMETTFDSVLLTYSSQQIFGLVVNAAYIGNVQTFTSTTENIDAPILNINYKVGDYGNLVGYGYWLDYTEAKKYEKSSQTYGVRFNGSSPKIYDHYNLHYTAEWGFQKDYGHGKTNYEADRINVMGGFTAYNITFQGAMEQLSGQGVNKTFDTPLGTNHAFQGWADLFLVTPANGIRDVFGTVIGTFDRGNLILTGVYHDFSDDTGGIHYGDEWDFQVVKKFGKHYSLLAKYAYYNDLGKLATTTDTQKIWFQANVTF
ncbi:MAG: alginate export family protein [Methylobacter sp.]